MREIGVLPQFKQCESSFSTSFYTAKHIQGRLKGPLVNSENNNFFEI